MHKLETYVKLSFSLQSIKMLHDHKNVMRVHANIFTKPVFTKSPLMNSEFSNQPYKTR